MKDTTVIANYKPDDLMWDEDCNLERLQPKYPWVLMPGEAEIAKKKPKRFK